MPPPGRRKLWDYLGPLAAALLVVSLVLTLWEPLAWWLEGEERYDNEAMSEWLQEARVSKNLPEAADGFLAAVREYRRVAGAAPAEGRSDELDLARRDVLNRRKELLVLLQALGDPVTKLYKTQLPLFPVVYRLEVTFDPRLEAELTASAAPAGLPEERARFLRAALGPVVWDSEAPRHKGQYRELPRPVRLSDAGAFAQVQYGLRIFASQQEAQRKDAARQLRLSGLATLVITLLLLWAYVAQGRERERQAQVDKAERRRLQEELRREEAERRHQEAERSNLELKSQLWANIGIMAGSYAHNIKNLLVRPNDLLSRCLEADGLSGDQGHMLQEVRHTLGTVTERLGQILQTVRRDPTQARRVRLDLNGLLADLQRTWGEMAAEKWKLALTLEPAPGPLWVEGDVSHLQQALENLLFNARDATFEMRNHLREQARARPADGAPGPDRRQALIAAASWKGEVALRALREGGRGVVEVRDNGIGMTEEVRRRCTETHFSTKRNNALFAGLSAGMGLGLSFLAVILEHHGATMTVTSEPLQGATFRLSFPLAPDAAAEPAPAGLAETGQGR